MITILTTVLAALICYLIWSYYGDRLRVYVPRALTLLNIGITRQRQLIWFNLKSLGKTITFSVFAVLVILWQFLFCILLYPAMVLFILIKTTITKPIDSKR